MTIYPDPISETNGAIMSDTKFPDGMFVNKPHERAPDFVKGSISIKATEFCQMLKRMSDNGELSKGYVNIDIKESRNGKWYAAINDYKPQEKAPEPQTQTAPPADLNDDLPF